MGKQSLVQLFVKSVFWHEAGHYVVARRLGFQTGGCRIEIHDRMGGHHGECEIKLYRAITEVKKMIDYLENRVQVLYAGALAESTALDGSIRNEVALRCLKRLGGRSDYDKARELIQALRNLRYPDTLVESGVQKELDEIDSELYNRAAHLVIEESRSINAVGTFMCGKFKGTGKTVSLTQDEIDGIPEIVERFNSR